METDRLVRKAGKTFTIWRPWLSIKPSANLAGLLALPCRIAEFSCVPPHNHEEKTVDPDELSTTNTRLLNNYFWQMVIYIYILILLYSFWAIEWLQPQGSLCLHCRDASPPRSPSEFVQTFSLPAKLILHPGFAFSNFQAKNGKTSGNRGRGFRLSKTTSRWQDPSAQWSWCRFLIRCAPSFSALGVRIFEAMILPPQSINIPSITPGKICNSREFSSSH